MFRFDRLPQGTFGSWSRVGMASLALALMVAPRPAQAQTATIYGSLGNFDVVNNTGHHAHGFEVELEGLQEGDVYYTFSAQRYGAPRVVPYATGVRVVWSSAYDAANSHFTHTTIAKTPGVAFAGTCYQWNPATYDAAGCEHFGISLRTNPGRVISRWLIENPEAPGTLVAAEPPMPVAAPTYFIAAPARVGDPPQLVVEVEAPEPAEAPELYGDAQWMRVFVTQLPREATLDELVADNNVVPQDATKLETDWQIIQDEPAAGGNGNRRRKRNSGNLLPTTRSVIRRIEMYNYTGAYDPLTHEAICADGLCNVPSDGEMGDFISAQMTAANVQSDYVAVTLSGNGNVESSDRFISCGNKCVAPYSAASVVTLTAKAGSGSQFAGWTGACTGLALTCDVTVNGGVNVGATFTVIPTTGGGGGGGGATGGGGGGGTTAPVLSVKLAGGKGLVVSAPAGINCGKTCSTAVAAGTTLTLTATPEPGFRFVNWTGACTGSQTTCSVAVNRSATAQANFTK